MSIEAIEIIFDNSQRLCHSHIHIHNILSTTYTAEWLVTQDRYEEAMDAFKKSGRADLARKVLSELTENAVTEKRFKDAGYYFWMLSKDVEQEALTLSKTPDSGESAFVAVFLLMCQY